MDSALIVAIVAVVLGGVGLIGGVLGYVQGMNALARATHARQRAVVAEEEALQARAAAEATARAAEEMLDHARAAAARAVPPATGPVPPVTGPVPPVTGPVPSGMPTPTTGSLLLPERTGPTPLPPVAEVVPVRTGPTASVPPAVEPEAPDADAPLEPVPAEQQPAEHFSIPLVPPAEDAGAGPSDEAATDGEAAPDAAEAATPEEEPGAPRDEQGRVVAGAQDAPTMDWAEVLKTGAIPLPSISRGTYAAPRRRPKPTGEGPARFELRAVGRQRFEAVNVGGEPAEEARIESGGEDPHLVRPLSSRPATVEPAHALAFSVLRVEGRHATVAVVWTRDGEPVRQELPLD